MRLTKRHTTNPADTKIHIPNTEEINNRIVPYAHQA